MALFLLFESAAGYGLFEHQQSEEIGDQLEEVQKSIEDFGRFHQMVKLTAFESFTTAEEALENINAVSEGVLAEKLRNFLEQNLPSVKSAKKKKSKFQLGVSEEKLATSIQDDLEIACIRNQKSLELLRGIRLHFPKFLKELKESDLGRAQLGLAHSYSRAKIKFNINRADNHIIQAICLLDQMDKDCNTFAMRCREWYSWHFPELAKIVQDNLQYARVVIALGSRANITEEKQQSIAEAVVDEDKAKEIVDAARSSMGTDISDFDMHNIEKFAKRVVCLCEYRQHLHGYLEKKMKDVAPNLSTLVGDQVGARLIAHAGSLVNLAKYPASTVQILGAEKALFRALKTKGNTPKYGLIFHSSFIGRAGTRDKGRISRYLANKCSIASRIDSFSEQNTTVYGEKLREQVEERLQFYETGQAPRKNADVMSEAKAKALSQVKIDGEDEESDEEMTKATTPKKDKKKDKKKKEKKSKGDDDDDEESNKKSKKDKKSKKRKREEDEDDEKPKKKKKKQ